MSVINITNDSEFETQLKCTKSLVIIDFSASWCGPCRRIAPAFEQFAAAYPAAAFLKVDVDVCQETALSHGVSSVPCFVFYKDGIRIDSVTGSDCTALEGRVKRHYPAAKDGSPDDGLVDLAPYMTEECATAPEGSYISADGRLVVLIAFSQAVEIHSIALSAPERTGPMTVKLYVEDPSADALTSEVIPVGVPTSKDAPIDTPIQALSVAAADLASGVPMPLQASKFRNVRSLRISAEESHDGSSVCRIDHVRLFGSPVPT